MGKQYTFKTTRDTQWLEPLLDALASNERSMTIRESLTLYFDDQRPAVTRQTQITQKVTPKVPLEVLKELPKVTHNKPMFEAIEVDLESTLDNLDF